MGTAAELEIKPEDTVTAVTARKVLWDSNHTLSLDDLNKPGVSLEATVYKAIVEPVSWLREESPDSSFAMVVLASTNPDVKPGTLQRIHDGFRNFVGGPGDKTRDVLERKGVEVVFDARQRTVNVRQRKQIH